MAEASAEALTFARGLADQLGVGCEALLIVDESFAALIERGYLRVVYGGAAEGYTDFPTYEEAK